MDISLIIIGLSAKQAVNGAETCANCTSRVFYLFSCTFLSEIPTNSLFFMSSLSTSIATLSISSSRETRSASNSTNSQSNKLKINNRDPFEDLSCLICKQRMAKNHVCLGPKANKNSTKSSNNTLQNKTIINRPILPMINSNSTSISTSSLSKETYSRKSADNYKQEMNLQVMASHPRQPKTSTFDKKPLEIQHLKRQRNSDSTNSENHPLNNLLTTTNDYSIISCATDESSNTTANQKEISNSNKKFLTASNQKYLFEKLKTSSISESKTAELITKKIIENVMRNGQSQEDQVPKNENFNFDQINKENIFSFPTQVGRQKSISDRVPEKSSNNCHDCQLSKIEQTTPIRYPTTSFNSVGSASLISHNSFSRQHSLASVSQLSQLQHTRNTLRTETALLGTPDYIAPELLEKEQNQKDNEQKSHDKSVDFWALGCCMYQFLIGIAPFTDSSVKEIFQRIKVGNIEWPDGEVSNIRDENINLNVENNLSNFTDENGNQDGMDDDIGRF